ncbi:hypothetical protein AAVH_29960 [Aphelenchoides avenae]|nr:hypothetical protein AAVH_29960 [Aphelenchus avenae]
MPPLTFFLLTSLILAYVGAETPSLRIAAESKSSVWNAVAVDTDGTVYVSGPRWASDDPMGVARLGPDGPQPYPNAEWNSWTISEKNLTGLFVGVNAIRTDSNGSLWVVDTGTVQFGGAPLRLGGAKLVRIDLRTDSVSRIYPLDDAVTDNSYVDDVRFSGDHAYLSDAGHPGIIVLCLKTCRRRVRAR